MCNIKLSLSEGEKSYELEMVDYDKDMLKYVIDKLSGVFCPQQEEEDPSLSWKEGYQTLATTKVGLHDPGSEYSLPDKKSLEENFQEAAASVETIEPMVDNQKAIVSKSTPMFNRHEGKRQLYYICECGNRGKHYISTEREYVSCHQCPNDMMVRLANPRGPEYKDEHGNNYIAGEYKKTMKDKEVEEQFWKEKQAQAI